METKPYVVPHVVPYLLVGRAASSTPCDVLGLFTDNSLTHTFFYFYFIFILFYFIFGLLLSSGRPG